MKKSKKRRKGFDGIPGMKNMRCPYCGRHVLLRSADGIYKENMQNARLYVCSAYPECDSYVRVHPGTAIPVGSLANGKLRALRRAAHRHFDKLHECGLMSKSDAYNWLAHTLQSPQSQAHIGYLSEYCCNLVISECGKYLDTWSHKIENSSHMAQAGGGAAYAAQ